MTQLESDLRRWVELDQQHRFQSIADAIAEILNEEILPEVEYHGEECTCLNCQEAFVL